VKIILTHEQTDFDALASMLAAHLLDKRSIPVLPRRLNRNVQAYITLYGLDMPFVDPRDLPKKKIDNVTLVDTQSMVSVKGIHKGTKVKIVDHHPPKEGIYEDTGGLTYSRTNERYLRAAAYLLSKGANLQIAGDFLNHPLSLEQQSIYDALRESIETHDIHGFTVMISCGDATKSNEELSSIAHKLRDSLELDALILLIETKSGIQLVARTTTDNIDAGRLAKHFGGGGHNRASAALVRGRKMDIVQPAITVVEIMSRGPQIISPATPVEKAAEQMQRYGYEGYPVVENGIVVGLLTRRAVDRTLSHKLKLKTKDVMEAGSASVLPTASIEMLQQVMLESGWGQVPVVDPDDGKVIGIVTRTDLIKTMTPLKKKNGFTNLAHKLEASLLPERLGLLKIIAETAEKQRNSFYMVGGFVRDLILGRPSNDFDLVVEGDAIALGTALAEKFGGRVVLHKRFRTAKWQLGDISESLAEVLSEQYGGGYDHKLIPDSIDLITARREFYTEPTVLPTVESGSIKLDLHRRDFTINTLALRLDGQHYGDMSDHWGGLADLKAGLVRVLHSLSFVDDPTRILRAVRFEKRFDFQIEERTLELINRALPLLGKLSGDRLRHELNIIFEEENRKQIISRLDDLGVLQSIHPSLKFDGKWMSSITQILNKGSIQEWGLPEKIKTFQASTAFVYLYWLVKLKNDPDPIIDTLRLPGWLADDIRTVIELKKKLTRNTKAKKSEMTMMFEDASDFALFSLFHISRRKWVKDAVLAYINEWQYIKPKTKGSDLKAMGFQPGPEFKSILGQIRAAMLDGKIKNADEEKALLNELLNEQYNL
jgi:tRNA nucleotidyltransferase (CCA-adding enzyme)